MDAILECCQKKRMVNKMNIHMINISIKAHPNKWYLKKMIDQQKFNET
jgi:hypothetical protein